MGLMTAAAMPLFLECLSDALPAGAVRSYRERIAGPHGLDAGPLAALRASFIEANEPLMATGARDLERKGYMLRPLAAVMDPFDAIPTTALSPAIGNSAYLAALESFAVYGNHLMRDMFARFTEVAGVPAGDFEMRHGAPFLNGKALSTEEVHERVGMVYETTYVEAWERLLEAAWRERASNRNRLHRTDPVAINGCVRWNVDRDAFEIGPRGLSWYRNGVTWFGEGYVCGVQPLLRYSDPAVVRLNRHNVDSSVDAWRGPHALQLVVAEAS